MNTNEREWEPASKTIIGCAFDVSNYLGCGFLEKVYENALAYEMRQAGLTVEQQKVIKVHYKNGVIVGDYAADMVVESLVLVELKAVQELNEIHVAQCLNYLKVTGLPVCLLLNFGEPKVTVKRLLNKFYSCSSVFIRGSKGSPDA